MNLYDQNDLIDYSRIESIIKKNNFKKIILFGGGTAAKILYEKLLYKYNISYIVDNNEQLWDKKIGKIKIKAPTYIGKEKRGDFIIFILSRWVIKIKEELNSYGLTENFDYYNIYSEFDKYFLISKFDRYTEQFIKFLNNIPNNIFESVKIKENSAKIGVVCNATIGNGNMWYSVVLYLLLKLNGYDVTLIVENISTFANVIFFEDQHFIIQKYVDYVVKVLECKFGIQTVDFIFDGNGVDLSEEDYKKVKQLAKLNADWQQSSPEQLKQFDYNEKVILFEIILARNLRVIKEYFEQHQYDTINVRTGLHRQRGLYTWVGNQKNIRVSSFDGIQFSAEFPACQRIEANKILRSSLVNSKLKNLAVKWAKIDFYQRKIGDMQNTSNYQQINYIDSRQLVYDVVIPLNIRWDGAALGLDNLFSSYEEWLYETVEFLINNTKVNILIREHPAQEFWQNFSYPNYSFLFEKLYGKNDRLYYCKSNEKINTYRVIENCKVVIPYTSTIGIEAAIMGKDVVLNTNVSYKDFEICYTPHTKKEYFSLILDILSGKNQIELQNREINSYLAYYAHMTFTSSSEFNTENEKWVKKDFLEIAQETQTKYILDTIAENIPLFISKLEHNLPSN